MTLHQGAPSILTPPTAQHDDNASHGAATAVRAQAEPGTADNDPDTTAVLWVKGLACPYCVQNIDRQLVDLPGIDAVHVDLPTGKVTIALTPESPASRQALVDAIDNSGFTLDRLEMPGR